MHLNSPYAVYFFGSAGKSPEETGVRISYLKIRIVGRVPRLRASPRHGGAGTFFFAFLLMIIRKSDSFREGEVRHF